MDRQATLCLSVPPMAGPTSLASSQQDQQHQRQHQQVSTRITFNCHPQYGASQQLAAQNKRKEKARIAARLRRSQEADIIMDMANELQISQEKMRRIDKTTIIKLAIDYIRAFDILCRHDDENRQQQQQVANVGAAPANSARPAPAAQPTRAPSTRLQNMSLNNNNINVTCEKQLPKTNKNDIDPKIQRQQTRRINKININQSHIYQRGSSSSEDEDEDGDGDDVYDKCVQETRRETPNNENINTLGSCRHQHEKNYIKSNTNHSLLRQIHKSRRIEPEELPLTLNAENNQHDQDDIKSAKQEYQVEQSIERPNISTASIFEPKTTENMNEHYLMINENENEKSAAFVLKLDDEILDEDDLTHLAPQAGDVHILLDVEPLDNIVLDLDKTANLFAPPLSATSIISNCHQIGPDLDKTESYDVSSQQTINNRRDFVYSTPTSLNSDHQYHHQLHHHQQQQQQHREASCGRQQQTMITSFRGGTDNSSVCVDNTNGILNIEQVTGNYSNVVQSQPIQKSTCYQEAPVYFCMDTKLLAENFYADQQPQYRQHLQQTHDI